MVAGRQRRRRPRALGRAGCWLSAGRLAGVGLPLTIAAVSLVHDVYRGILSVEYLILVYLLVVIVVPYRSWQALLLGSMREHDLAAPSTLSCPSVPVPKECS